MANDPNHTIKVRASTLRDWQRRSLVAHGHDVGLVHVSAQAYRYWPNEPDRLAILRTYRYPEAYHADA